MMAVTPVNIDLVNLNRLVDRLQQNILNSEPSTEYRLRSSSYQRAKTTANVDFAKKLLQKVDNDTANIKLVSKQQEIQLKLNDKRRILDQITQKLQELSETAIDPPQDPEGEDILRLITSAKPDAIDDQEPPQQHLSLWENLQSQAPILTSPESTNQSFPSERDQLFPSTLRSRNKNASTQPQQAQDTAHTTSTSNPSTLNETLLTHNRTEQEDLTTQMLTLAQALKASSQAISDALDADSSVVDHAVSTMDKSTGTLEAAQRSMGYLVKMSESTGWWGRIMLYLWIAGLAFVAFMMVTFMPKLRF